MDVHKPAFLKETVYGERGGAPDAEDGGKEVCPGAQMLDGPQKFHAVAFFLQGVVRRGHTLHLNRGGFQFQRLFCLRGKDDRPGGAQGGSHVLRGDLRVVGQRGGVHHDLQVPETGTVI